MNGFRKDYDWQFAYLEAAKRIIGPLLLEPSPFELDAKEATDMLVLTARDMRIACRIRRARYANQYPWEFTFRSRRDTGAETELSKVIKGFGDWFFYGFAAHDELPSLARWALINLHHWRAHMINDGIARAVGQSNLIRQGQKPNGDGTYFQWFDIRSFPADPPILVASSHDLPTQKRAPIKFVPVGPGLRSVS